MPGETQSEGRTGRASSERFFRTREVDGVWWLIDPNGAPMLSKGVNTVRFDQDYIGGTTRAPYAEACAHKYGGVEAWRGAAAGRLASLGFNTLGAWSDVAVGCEAPDILAVTPNLDLGLAFATRAADQDSHEPFPDLFSADFERHAEARARELCTPWRDDPRVIGWFTDNELRWGADWRGGDELLAMFLNRPANSPARTAAIAFLHERYPDFADFASVWRTGADSWEEFAGLTSIVAPYARKPVYERDDQAETRAKQDDLRRGRFVSDCEAFARRVAERYFSTVRAAVLRADPNHLILGCRFAYVPEIPVIDAAGRHVDVLSFNCYGFDPVSNLRAYARTDKPCLVGEFSFRAIDSGLPNTVGAAPLVPTQEMRASAFRHYVTTALQDPRVVGYHWFEHADQPREGRFDGENSNYGIVTIDDTIYAELARTMMAVNADAEQIHQAAARHVA